MVVRVVAIGRAAVTCVAAGAAARGAAGAGAATVRGGATLAGLGGAAGFGAAGVTAAAGGAAGLAAVACGLVITVVFGTGFAALVPATAVGLYPQTCLRARETRGTQVTLPSIPARM
ncbi:MAG: hypothetical protein ACK5MY_03030 [Jhaorihella sp.]